MDFNDSNFAELDKELTPEERAEWQAIYASYRSESIIRGEAVGVDFHEFEFIPEGKKRPVKQNIKCVIVISYRIKIIIPETEMFLNPLFNGKFVYHTLCGSQLDYIVTHIDREGGFAVASRKKALEKLQWVTNRRSLENRIVNTNVISVGKSSCVINYRGYDVILHQRDISYITINDLREILHSGEQRMAKVKEFSPDDGILKLSIKETMPHPFDGVEIRHPIGAMRIATVVGKYGGGVFCRLYDNSTDVLCSYNTMHYDGDFQIGDRVEIVIRKLNREKRLVYGKMIRKI